MCSIDLKQIKRLVNIIAHGLAVHWIIGGEQVMLIDATMSDIVMLSNDMQVILLCSRDKQGAVLVVQQIFASVRLELCCLKLDLL